MGKLSGMLMRKVRYIQLYYKTRDTEIDMEMVTEKDQKLFESMQRWHLNAHVTDDEWFNIYERIKSKLKTPTQFNVEDLPDGLDQFVKSKMANKSLQNQFIVSEIFPDMMEYEILRYYRELIDKEKQGEGDLDEFNEDEIFGSVKLNQGDIVFFHRVFQPYAIYAMYREKHCDVTDTKQLMNECFSLGSGCKRRDLLPEVNAYCDKCCGANWENIFEKLNTAIFNRQIQNKFNLPYDYDDSSDLDEEGPKESCLEVIEIENPFLSDNSSDKASLDQDEYRNSPTSTFSCDLCAKGFSQQLFLQMHTKLFHKDSEINSAAFGDCHKDSEEVSAAVHEVNKLTTEFVSDEVELITSFVRSPDSSPGKVEIDLNKEGLGGERFTSVVAIEYVNDVDLITSFSEVDADRQRRRQEEDNVAKRKSKCRKALHF